MIERAHGAAVVFDRPEEEVYYPAGEPFPVDGRHWHACIDVVLPLRGWLRDKPDAWVGTARQIHYNRDGACRVVIPEVAVCFGVDAAEQERRESYRVWETRVAPAWVLEVASRHAHYYDQMRFDSDFPNTDGDTGVYAALGVAEFWRTDPTGQNILTPPLQGYRLDDGQWHPITIAADAGGALRGHSDVLGLDLTWRDGDLRLYDPATEMWLLTYDDRVQAQANAETRAERAEAQAAAQAAEVARLKELLRSRGSPEAGPLPHPPG